jgi:Tol biopolymer transport system component
VRGWIVYTSWYDVEWGDETGIWAVDPTRPEGDASDRLQLRHLPGGGVHFVEGSPALQKAAVPLDWSDDGTKLLIWESNNEQGSRLAILNADGTKTTVRNRRRTWFGGSLSPDGSQVAFANWRWISRSKGVRPVGISVVDTDGGRPHLIKKAGRTGLYDPVFSPDGTKIAYIDGMGDHSNGLRVMDADGSHVRVLLESDGEFSDGIDVHCGGALAWSPDGSRLAFCADGGIWVIGADGSGLRKLIPKGEIPNWSPDGSRIAYQVRAGPLRIADADGKNVQTFTYGGSGPWNPLPPPSD